MVYGLARWINREREIIPRASIEKPPSAELRPNQTDQDTLPPYEVLDAILELYVEENLGAEEIAARGFDEKTVRWVLRRVDLNEYKRAQAAPGLKVTSRAFGVGGGSRSRKNSCSRLALDFSRLPFSPDKVPPCLPLPFWVPPPNAPSSATRPCVRSNAPAGGCIRSIPTRPTSRVSKPSPRSRIPRARGCLEHDLPLAVTMRLVDDIADAQPRAVWLNPGATPRKSSKPSKRGSALVRQCSIVAPAFLPSRLSGLPSAHSAAAPENAAPFNS